ncbi:hypothetical protein FACS189490_00700 [Clostridia bacterium]|nr:hypothetical protein FACS189490_00700 [Clostridia bacterium]
MPNSFAARATKKTLSPRQIHLDFHTSEYIPDVAENFSAESFARVMKEAYVTSATVFARCHHGWLYYDSKKFPERVHPSLVNSHKNLLLEQVRALHEAGLRAPVYITVQWDYQSAKNNADWLIRGKDGNHEGDSFDKPGFYQSLCVNTGYYDYLAAVTREVCEILGTELDGIFFDIVSIRPCYCGVCREKMKLAGVDVSDDLAVRRFAAKSIDEFKREMTALVREYSEDCTIFYNAGHIGPCTKESAKDYTHFELESLPSGAWGYLHFPATARYAKTLSRDSLGMTGKFHTEWGDFHSLKNRAALEFECFRMLSFGMGCSIGDQLEPNGSLNPATYDLIGGVYKMFEEREAWAIPSERVAEAALITPEAPERENSIPASIMGAVQLLEELSLQFEIIDREMDFSDYRLVILPGDLTVTEEFQKRLDGYVENGGKVLAFAKGGLSDSGKYPVCFGAKNHGTRDIAPDFIIAEDFLAELLYPSNEYAMYLGGEIIEPVNGGKSVLSGRAPYFKKEGDRFCSHKYVPSSKTGGYPCAVENNGTILFSHPILTQYRKNAPMWCKLLVKSAINRLLGGQIIIHNGPSYVRASILRQPEHNRYAAHFLSYVPIRKSETIDIIEERTKLYNVEVKINVPEAIKQVRVVPNGVVLDYKDGKFTIPEIDGYAIVELSY